VRIPANSMIGGENEGWRVAQATLEVEHGGGGRLGGFGDLTYKLIDYAKNATRNGERISSDPVTQEVLTKLYIDTQIGRLFNARNYWMRHARVPFTRGEGTQSALYGKIFMHRLAKDVLDVVGPYALTKDEQWAPLHGILEHDQRYSLSTHAGGTPEAQRISMSRRLGLGRTPQKPADTY
jgi:alkylation response protein AidB-like acyl-CoA dehydrogenase